ncbi:hypothetical protein TSAR_002708 [Trichomalopsis sarcophagae]|uniref:Receptor expression-enhancing protein n=1 Tax=Trichomalopsis sarcophagae TaxID=543379 RepID=A0A232FF09_9HYME|nr:hypothetical protein TSAR_002708 [Trichomalopsis sarcophagae]
MSARLESSMTTKNYEATWSTFDEKLLTNERKLKDLLDISSSNDEESILCSFGASGGTTISRMLARKSIVWAKDSLERLPIRLTLENVGVFTLFLVLLMPRAITYWLLYPLYRLVFGTLYPAYASYKAVRTKNVKEYVKWMMYWIVFALFTCAETFTDVFFSFWFPFYYEIKIILVLWLLSPATKGSSILYRRFVHPALCRREAEIDDALARATEQGYTAVLQLGTKGVNYATTVLMQTAIKNLPNVVPIGALAASQSDPAISSLANRRASPSRSATDGTTMAEPQEQMSRRKPRRRSRSENVMEVKTEKRHYHVEAESDGSELIDVYEDLDMDYMPSEENTEDSLHFDHFKEPEPAVVANKNNKKTRDDSVTRRKPRTRGNTGRNVDSEFSD